jgi:MYXO-CTERM domain-containing protein
MVVNSQTRRALSAALTLAAGSAIAALSPAAASASTITWTGGTGNWNDGSNWTGGANGTGSVPSATDTIAIDGGNTGVNSVVTYNLTSPLTTSGELVIDAGDSLLIPKPATGTPGTLTLGTFATGSFSNAGTVNLSGATTWGMTLVNNSSSVIANAPVNSGLIEATGGGTLQINDNAETNNTFSNVGGTIALTNGSALEPVNGPIIYGGSINVDATSKIITNGNSNQVVWFENAAYQNHGTLATATNSAGNGVTVVEFNGSSAITNSGTISATYTGASVGYTTEMIIGTGMYVARGTTTPNLLDQTTFTNTGTVTIGDNATSSATGETINSRLVFNTAGAIINDGQINVSNTGTAANGSTASINLSQNTAIGNSLGGTGSINFNDHVGNYVGTTPGFVGAAPTLTLGAGQTVTGAVALGNGQLNVTNNGVINASGTNNPIVISTKNNSFINNGTLHVSGAAGATIADSSFSNAGTLSVDNTRVLADSGSLTFTGGGYTVQIDSTTGTSGQIEVTGDLALGAGVASLSVTDVGNTVLPVGDSFTLIDPSSSTGFFTGLPQGSDLTVGGNTYSVSYTGGAGGDDVTLTSVAVTPEPGAFALFALGGFAVLRRRRARNIA